MGAERHWLGYPPPPVPATPPAEGDSWSTEVLVVHSTYFDRNGGGRLTVSTDRLALATSRWSFDRSWQVGRAGVEYVEVQWDPASNLRRYRLIRAGGQPNDLIFYQGPFRTYEQIGPALDHYGWPVYGRQVNMLVTHWLALYWPLLALVAVAATVLVVAVVVAVLRVA